MFLFSAALRSARTARARISTDPHLLLAQRNRRDALAVLDGTDEPTTGGPFLHWVPDHPDGDRLAGEFLPMPVDEAEAIAAEQPRRRHRAPEVGGTARFGLDAALIRTRLPIMRRPGTARSSRLRPRTRGPSRP